MRKLVMAAGALLLMSALTGMAACGGDDSEEARFYEDRNLGVEFSYPAGWIEGAVPTPYASCEVCAVFGPDDAAHPHGVQVFSVEIPGDAGEGEWPVTAFVGNRALPQGEERALSLGGRDARQLDILRQAPIGLVNETGDDTPYHETWTLVPLADRRAVFLVAFYRDGDEQGREDALAGYAMILEHLVIR